MTDGWSEITVLLRRAGKGDGEAKSKVFDSVQNHLHLLAERHLAREQMGNSVQATMLVHDADLRVVGSKQPIDLVDRTHFCVLAVSAMRRLLVDRARSHLTRRWGGASHVRAHLELEHHAGQHSDERLIALHEALGRLKNESPRQATVVELRHFGGYRVRETAEYLHVSPSTVKQNFSKALLFRELTDG